MRELPAGTIAFLFTDIEGSTRLWEKHPDAMRVALSRHDSVLRGAVESNGGVVFKTMGDAFCAAFSTAADAVDAALSAQRALQNLPASALMVAAGLALRVRMALHAGSAEVRDGDYFGSALNRVARLLTVGHGGQILLSASAQELTQDSLPADASLLDLGLHGLRDLQRPEHLFQLLHPQLPSEFPPLRSSESIPNNLPQQLTSFVGREQEITVVRGLMSNTRLLTLTGAGGAGKTRLSLQVAAEVMDQFPDGAWLVELAPVGDPSLVPQTSAAALKAPEDPSRSAIELLQAYLKNKSLLLLLDNCEHLMDACAELAYTLLRSCPALRILASSREALGIAGETTYRVPSLSVPDLKHLPSLEAMTQYEAVRLFIERASSVLPSFAVTSENAPAIAQICHRLDGIPLAIELAAARVKVLKTEQISRRLDDRFRLLTGGSRTALPRQQTLRAAIDWSYDLLPEPERALLRRLSVFVGGWSLEAAEGVCSGDPVDELEVLDLLSRLADKSLVNVDESSERYGLLETVRQYCRERLLEAGEGAAYHSRHRDWFLALAEESAPSAGFYNLERRASLDRLDTDHDNLRASLEWSMDEDLEKMLRLAPLLGSLWISRGHLKEASDRLRDVLCRAADCSDSIPLGRTLGAFGTVKWLRGDRSTSTPLLERCIAICMQLGADELSLRPAFMLGQTAMEMGDLETCHKLLNRSLEIATRSANPEYLAGALRAIGSVALHEKNYVEARARFDESLARSRATGDVFNAAQVLNCLGELSRILEDFQSAAVFYEESLEIFREIGAPWTLQMVLGNLVTTYCEIGQTDKARSVLREGLRLNRDLDNRAGLALYLSAAAALAVVTLNVERAARFIGCAEAQFGAIGHRGSHSDEADHERTVTKVAALLGADAFEQLRAEGAAMSLEQAISEALAGGEGVSPAA